MINKPPNEIWKLNLNKGIIKFGHFKYQIQILGIYSLLSKKWSWITGTSKNPSGREDYTRLENSSPSFFRLSQKLKEFGHRNNLKEFTQSSRMNKKQCKNLLSLCNILTGTTTSVLAEYSATGCLGLLLTKINTSDESDTQCDSNMNEVIHKVLSALIKMKKMDTKKSIHDYLNRKGEIVNPQQRCSENSVDNGILSDEQEVKSTTISAHCTINNKIYEYTVKFNKNTTDTVVSCNQI
jgi:hypothetical protein